MYFLLKNWDIPASYVSLPEGNWFYDICLMYIWYSYIMIISIFLFHLLGILWKVPETKSAVPYLKFQLLCARHFYMSNQVHLWRQVVWRDSQVWILDRTALLCEEGGGSNIQGIYLILFMAGQPTPMLFLNKALLRLYFSWGYLTWG